MNDFPCLNGLKDKNEKIENAKFRDQIIFVLVFIVILTAFYCTAVTTDKTTDVKFIIALKDSSPVFGILVAAFLVNMQQHNANIAKAQNDYDLDKGVCESLICELELIVRQANVFAKEENETFINAELEKNPNLNYKLHMDRFTVDALREKFPVISKDLRDVIFEFDPTLNLLIRMCEERAVHPLDVEKFKKTLSNVKTKGLQYTASLKGLEWRDDKVIDEILVDIMKREPKAMEE